MTSRSAFDIQTLNFPEPTPEDIEALDRAEQLNKMSPAEYLEFLHSVSAHLPPSRETNSDSDEPFTL